ncbi:AI-2E family transporter [Sphingomonas ginsenosidivorax]|uniref:AI-2E family transporter n=1 Tax=Sphingomonas ginsenosidivorax TaxID=862135 RepID=A0A5C6UFL3_9SPHN|nr:AI-2E family transporter [Sphingomonas ginsenosidivorax]TXC71572.1 AI-2E family transporter [Sphingomonas ginsenosidivorax]
MTDEDSGVRTAAEARDPAADGAFGIPFGVGAAEALRIAQRRDRLLAALTLTAGIGLVIALPFALKAGAEFFLPLTTALVIAVALVPVLEWLERRGLPSPLASLLCILVFLIAVNIAIAAILVPATDFFRLLPTRLDRIQHNLAPLLDLYSSLEKYVNRTLRQVASTPIRQPATAGVAAPGSILEVAATSAPAVIVQFLFGTLIVFFFLSGWTGMRRQTITGRTSFDGAMATARVIQDVVDDVSAYLGTITVINVILGVVTGTALWAIGMPYPAMWGGVVALLNYIPYFGPVIGAFLLALGGLMTFSDIWMALLPPALMYGLHLVEANAITPFVVGHRLTISPLLILISLSFWGWVWGTLGALLAVPLLIILQTVLGAAGKPDIAGFLFEHGTLVQQRGRNRGKSEQRETGG